MDEGRLKTLLEDVGSGRTSTTEALEKLKHLPFEELSFACVDHHRQLRQGIPEVIFAENKTPEETLAIASTMLKRSGKLLITRASSSHHEVLTAAALDARIEYNSAARSIVISGVIFGKKRKSAGKGDVLIITAGTSDIPVAEEAAVTAEFLGSRVTTVFDVGVAGLHRIVDKLDLLSKARVVIVVAGMEGALPSLVGGLIGCPLVAVPTSVGYGTSLGGLTALFAMLNSCVPGIAVMNIDNGFGAACLAHKINIM